MPIYEYQCQQCQHKLEVMQRLSDVPLATCPACSKDALKKLISAVGFQLKGTGWYETDFKTKPKQKSESGGDSESKSDTATAKDDGAGSKGKSDGESAKPVSSESSKSESKSESKTTTPASSSD